MTLTTGFRLLSTTALTVLLCACAGQPPAPQPVLVAGPNQCVVPPAGMEVPATGPVPYEVLEARCGAIAWCAGWQEPQIHNLVFAQTFRQCVARGMGANTAVIVVPATPPAAAPVSRPPPLETARPPRPYRN
jgi:hypothetical protein